MGSVLGRVIIGLLHTHEGWLAGKMKITLVVSLAL